MDQSISISDEQRQALAASGGGPIYVVDPTSGAELVMLQSEAYSALVNGRSITETYHAAERALAGIWDDPELDQYNDAPA